MCAMIGAFYTFPGLRLGKMHWDSLRTCGDRRIRRLLLHASFLAPIFLVLLWVRPLSRRYFTEMIFAGYSDPIMSPAMFEMIRLVLVIVVGVIRVAMMPLYLQSYLNMASEKIEELKKETGKISNKQFQRKIARVFYYLCVVTLQYLAPVILCIFLSLMCKTLGGLEWRDLVMTRDASEECGLTPDGSVDPEFSASPLSSISQAESVSEASKTLSLGLEELKRIFTTEFYRGVLGSRLGGAFSLGSCLVPLVCFTSPTLQLAKIV
ncbi:UNVERIFIED_CONTAM: hypothetical protein GTU68_031247 [Idotea baltica]|nr:hypothetical protein [Idotea baltica]